MEYFESIWANLTNVFSYVDPILNRETFNGVSIWQDFVDSSALIANNIYDSFKAQIDFSYFIERLSNATSNGVTAATNATKAIVNEVYSGHFSSAIDVIKFEIDKLLLLFNFSDFQYRLLREFSLILVGNIFLVLLAWRLYGPRISARFLGRSGGSHKRIEELRSSMSELQLPKELDFKYK